MATISFRGLEIEGELWSDPGSGPCCSHGGEPPSSGVEDIYIVGVDCVDTLESWELLEGCGISHGVARMVYAWARMSGNLLGEAASLIEYHYEEEISDAFFE